MSLKIYEIATGFTPVPAKIGAATELVVENLVNNYSPENQVVLIDVKNPEHKEFDCEVLEINMPQSMMNPSSLLSIKHKLKRVVYSIKLALKIKKIQRKGSKNSIFHFHNQYNFAFSYAWTFLFRKNKRNNPWVYTVHSNLWFDKAVNKPQKKHYLEVYSIKRADVVICLNPLLAENIQSYFKQSLSGRLEIIPNGVNGKMYYPVQKKQEEDHLKILNVGSVYDGKNQLESLRIVTPFLLSGKCVFYFAGANADPVYMEEINAYIELHKLTENVHYLGEYPPGEKLNEVYNKADIYLSNSKSEAFSLVILEALAAGLPVILSETFKSSLNGLPSTDVIHFCGEEQEFHTVINSFLENRNSLKEAGISSRKYIENYFSWQQIAALHEKVYVKHLSD